MLLPETRSMILEEADEKSPTKLQKVALKTTHHKCAIQSCHTWIIKEFDFCGYHRGTVSTLRFADVVQTKEQ